MDIDVEYPAVAAGERDEALRRHRGAAPGRRPPPCDGIGTVPVLGKRITLPEHFACG